MNILVLDSHSIEDSRIGRHLRYLIENDFEVYRVNYNFYDPVSEEGRSLSRYGEAGSRLDFFDRLSKEVSQKNVENIPKQLKVNNTSPIETNVLLRAAKKSGAKISGSQKIELPLEEKNHDNK